MSDKVQAWSEIVKIPTYKIGIHDKNLMFLEKWVCTVFSHHHLDLFTDIVA